MPVHAKETLLIDDFGDVQRASNGGQWQYFSDRVMGGVSEGAAGHGLVNGRSALQLSGIVSLENNGGFIQVALDLDVGGKPLDAGAASGIAVCVCGDGGSYALNLRTADTQRPWQSYRSHIDSCGEWTTHYLSFETFTPHRIDKPLDRSRLRRVGLIAIGEPGTAGVAISRLALYSDPSS
ncbi:CIA30 family protein [Congregibacter variabilis]|uniref:CIA30 family protein n=1 Tax=Congregibacter variabilis TaxID=3081200 RepID=A0ABZ0I2P5_9GAMM|nr:CIA30 family protein [Congregibacter sp. IMCC43200]